MEIALNPGHDVAALAAAYRIKRRLQVRDVLVEPAAEQVLAALTATPWGLAYNQGDQVAELDAQAIARLTPADRSQIGAAVFQGARRGYQFLYAYYPLFRAYFTPGHPHIALFDVYEFINSQPMLDFVRALTGHSGIRWADAQATNFRAGHFLKYHTDEAPQHRRAAAYVMNFTKGWGRDWGGYLQFFNDRYDIEDGYRPVFNALNIFSVPMDHSVSMVASYAPGERLSVTGWFREDEPPAPIGGRPR